MGEEKTFKQRVESEARNFTQIYSSHLAAYRNRLRAFEETGSLDDLIDPWDYAFNIPFESATSTPEATGRGPELSNHAIVKAVHSLGLQELQLGALIISDVRISRALELGLLTADDLASLYVLTDSEQRSLGMGPVKRSKPDRDDPFFWRSLLEIFCRAYVASQGPRPWTLERKIDLAFDLDEIRRKHLDGKWTDKGALDALSKYTPYKHKYLRRGHSGGRGIGEDRIREIKEWIGPMDDDALDRLKQRFEAVFFEVAERRWADQHKPTTLDELRNVLGEADPLPERP